MKRHQKPTPRSPEGGIVEKDMPIHVSNVALLDPETNKPMPYRSQAELGKDLKQKHMVRESSILTNCSICHR